MDEARRIAASNCEIAGGGALFAVATIFCAARLQKTCPRTARFSTGADGAINDYLVRARDYSLCVGAANQTEREQTNNKNFQHSMPHPQHVHVLARLEARQISPSCRSYCGSLHGN